MIPVTCVELGFNLSVDTLILEPILLDLLEYLGEGWTGDGYAYKYSEDGCDGEAAD